ncbi:MAG: hypothetical protein U5K27_00740 [Desulfotignum sp.]|nr:hypothetical protein [Desulfotignum sp.]
MKNLDKKMLLIAGMVVVGAGIFLGAAAPKLIAWSSTPQFCNSSHVMKALFPG